MTISDLEATEFGQLLLEETGLDLSSADARTALIRIWTLIESFAIWLEKRKADPD
jgi:hypothetical protein